MTDNNLLLMADLKYVSLPCQPLTNPGRELTRKEIELYVSREKILATEFPRKTSNRFVYLLLASEKNKINRRVWEQLGKSALSSNDR